MNSTWHRGPFGPIQGSLGVLCVALLTSTIGCSSENQGGNEGGRGAGDVNDSANAVPWGPGEDCRPWGCGDNTSSKSVIAPPKNLVCSSGAECGSGFCVDGVCCDTACTGTCQACSASKKGQGADGTCGPIAKYGNPDKECQSGTCDGAGSCQSFNGVACSGPSTCLSGNCVDGVCCGNACTGTCQACTIAKRGGGYNGQCGPIAVGTDPDNECTNSECNGSGACQAPQGLGIGAACSQNAQCSSGFCADGVCCNTACNGTCQACSASKKTYGTDGTCEPIAATKNTDGECGSGYCNGAGACVYFNGASCSAASQCISGYCVDGNCCGNICNGPCMACTVAKRGGGYNGQCGPIAVGTDPDNECTNAECNGTGACQMPQGLGIGATCTQNAQCASGFCADGVCCNTACTGTCEACSATKKTYGANGTCEPIAATKNTDGECGSGYCNGSGACVYFNGVACTAGAQCISGNCVDGNCCGNPCNGPCMACTVAKRGGGYNGQCGPIANGTDPDSECGGAGVCNGSAMCSMVETGFACSSNAECSSGFCVDGTCCSTACTGTCMACNVAGSVGTCSFSPSGQGDANSSPACAGQCNGAGTCQSNNGAACTSGSQCLSHVCDDKVCAAVAAPAAPFQWATVLSATTSSTLGIGWIMPLANGGVSGAGTKTGTIDLQGWVLGAGPSQSQPWWFTFDAGGSPTDISDMAVNDADNEVVYFRARARYSEIVAMRHWNHAGGNSVYTSIVDAPSWSSTLNDVEITNLTAGDGGHILIEATVAPESPNGVDFGDGNLVTGDRVVKYNAAGQVEFNRAPDVSLAAILDPSGNFYDLQRQATNLVVIKQDGQGAALWTKTIPMTIGSNATATVAQVFDNAGNMLLAFNFNGTTDFGGGNTMTATGINDLGLAKLDSSGNVVWLNHFGTPTFNLTTLASDFTGDTDVVVVGYFAGTANLGNGDFTGGRFMAKFDGAGGLVWRDTPPSAPSYGLTGSQSGAVFVGTTAASANFGWGTPLSGTGGLIIAKYGN